MPSFSRDRRVERLLRAGPAVTTLVALPGGVLRMGSEARPDELPVRDVRVEPFAVALTPVTNVEYAAFLETTGHEGTPFLDDERFSRPDAPAVGISWFDAVDYCEWLSGLIGRRCRLPTEAEREYAARGGAEGVRYHWGDEPLDSGPFAFGASGTDRPLPVCSTPPNGYGLYHMCENVHEWCSDWYDRLGYPPDQLAAPRGVSDGERRASRGGSWRHRVKVSRISARSSLAPDRRYNDYGMRVYADE